MNELGADQNPPKNKSGWNKVIPRRTFLGGVVGTILTACGPNLDKLTTELNIPDLILRATYGLEITAGKINTHATAVVVEETKDYLIYATAYHAIHSNDNGVALDENGNRVSEIILNNQAKNDFGWWPANDEKDKDGNITTKGFMVYEDPEGKNPVVLLRVPKRKNKTMVRSGRISTVPIKLGSTLNAYSYPITGDSQTPHVTARMCFKKIEKNVSIIISGRRYNYEELYVMDSKDAKKGSSGGAVFLGEILAGLIEGCDKEGNITVIPARFISQILDKYHI